MDGMGGGPSAVAAGEEDNEDWEDDGEWDDGCEDDKRVEKVDMRKYVVTYHTEAGDVLGSRKAMQTYLQNRPDLDAEAVLSAVDFSQKFGRRAFLLGMENMDSQFEPLQDNTQLREGGGDSSKPEMSAGNEGQEMDQDLTSQDEQLARTMQAAFDEEARLNGYRPSARMGESFDDDDDDDDSYDGDEVGEVAAGGWRMREAQHDEECAEDHDISCLEVRTVSETEEGHCPVCQEEWKTGDEQRVLPCDHRFHALCVDRWLKQHKAQCPLCKKDVREDWEDEGEEVWDPVAGAWIPVGGRAAAGGDAPVPEVPPPAEDGEGAEGDEGSDGSWETVEDE